MNQKVAIADTNSTTQNQLEAETMNDSDTYTVTLRHLLREAESRFKKVKGSDGEARPKLRWEYAGFEPNCSEAIAINAALEDFGRKLIAENGRDWAYTPTSQTCNIAELQAYLERERAGWTRTVTKETLAACAAYYKDAAVRILGKSEVAAAAGATLIAEKLKAANGNPDVAKVFRANLISICEGETELEVIEPHIPVLDKLLEMLEDMEVSETVDAEAL